ncbi:MAG: HD domain-containing protein [Candidatus Poribacteria bacterium]
MIRIDLSLATKIEKAVPSEKVKMLFAYMEEKGQSFYDESVTQLQHALQCAHQATLCAVDASLVTSALLHDLGHFLLDERSDNHRFLSQDLNHEEIGSTYLQPFFPPSITEPIRLHVPAKRYLCTVDLAYYDSLSDASQRSFHVQGGAMSSKEKVDFEKLDYFEAATQLRIWDDCAKVQGSQVPDLEAYRDTVLQCLS